VNPSLTVAKYLPQIRDVNAQIGFLDIEAGPDPIRDLALWDDLAGPLDEHHQYVEGTPSKRNLDTIAVEQALERVKTVWPEGIAILSR